MYTKQISTKFSDCQVICWISFERSCKTLQRLRVASLKVAPSGLAKRRRKADFSLRQECQCLDGAEKVKIRQEPRAFKKESAHAGGNWVKPHGGSGVIFASKVATSSARFRRQVGIDTAGKYRHESREKQGGPPPGV